MRVAAAVDTHITIPRGPIKCVERYIMEALTIPNEAKQRAIKEGVPGAHHMPDVFELFEAEGDKLILPRGFALNLKRGLAKANIEVEWLDGRTRAPIDTSYAKPCNLKPYQLEPIERMLKVQQGTYEAPTGSGKTVTVLEFWRRLQQRTIVLTDRTNIAKQWRDRADEHLGITNVGIVGDGMWQVEGLTIGIIQTLWSRREQLDKERWWDRFGAVIIDEAHHTPAETWAEIIQRFPAATRIGVSATLERTEDDGKVVGVIIGPRIHTTSEDVVKLVKPTVEVVKTDFKFDFKNTLLNAQGRAIRRNNYAEMMSTLVKSNERNAVIARQLGKDRGHHVLVISRQKKHLEILWAMANSIGGWPTEKMFFLTGKEDSDERIRVANLVESLDECIIFSTIADEALDIPILDRIHLTFPTKKAYKIKQQLGRVRRAHEKKKDAKAYDYVDVKIGVLARHLGERKKVYKELGLEVVWQDTPPQQGPPANRGSLIPDGLRWGR